MNWPEILTALLIGVLVGGISQSLRYRYSRRLELREKIAQPLDHVFPIVRKLDRDVRFISTSLSTGSSDQEVAPAAVEPQVRSRLAEYLDWYNKFGPSIQLELRQQDRELLASLEGLLWYSNLASKEDTPLMPLMHSISDAIATAIERIERFNRKF